MNGLLRLAVCCSILGVSLSADADNQQAAKKKIEEGRRCIAAQDYDCALSAFKASYTLRPKPWVMFNIAMCQKALHRYVDAIGSFERFLQTEENPSASTRGLAEEALRVLEQLVGKVHLVEAPPGALVSVDGEQVGTTPLEEPLVLDPGRHVVNVSKDAFNTLNVEVIVASGAELEVRADLEHPRAEIKVACSGERTVVFVDDEAVGKCPYQGKVSVGVHEVKVIEPGKETFTQTVEAAAGATLVIAVDLKPVLVLNPPTFISEPGGTGESKLSLGLKIGGITALGLGAVSIGLGGMFTAKWNEAFDEVEDAVDAVDAANRPDNQQGYVSAMENYNGEKNDAESLRNAMVVGYVLGGGLMAIGTALLVGDVLIEKKETGGETLSVCPVPGGVALTF